MAKFLSFLILLVILKISTIVTASQSISLKTFDVVHDFGANKDGTSDASQAFLNAWNAACESSAPSQIYVPTGKYLLNPITFEGGNCKSNILFTIDGTFIANSFYNYENWIVFHSSNGLQIKGGVLDAKGQNIWHCKSSRGGCPKRAKGAKSLSFDSSKNIIVEGLTSMNSQMFHIGINNCENINIRGVTISADADSPNTDGIHLEHSQGITITQSKIMTGDDCISIGANNQNIWIQNIFCGPGHGISIGSLGRDPHESVVVRNVTVKSATFSETENGFRIKTFSTPAQGSVTDIYVLGTTMNNVRNPIIIDQNYCPNHKCPSGQGSGIQVSNVQFKGIHGSSLSEEIVTFDCSPKKPCYALTLQDIDLSYNSGTPKCDCKNAYWQVVGSMIATNCLAT